MTKLYVDYDLYNETRADILTKLQQIVEEGSPLSASKLVEIAVQMYDVTDKGMIGDIEIFKNVRDRLEEGRVMV